MPFLELFDETLDINSTENYELSVQAGFDGLSFSLLDTLRNKYIMLRVYEPDDDLNFEINGLQDIITRDDFLTKRFKKINLIAPSAKSTLVPALLYDASKREEYFTFNQVRLEEEVILTNAISDPDSILIFSLHSQIVGLLKEVFPNRFLSHPLRTILKHISISTRATGNNYIQVHLEKDYLNLIIFDQNTLNFCNTFHYKTISDIHYYVMYVLKRMNISQGETVYFSGRTNNSKEIISGFSDYLNTIRFAEPTGNFTFSYIFNETDLHKFLNLFTITNCE